VTYWKKQKSTLKVGMEFEFNLPEQVGTCRGDNIACPCAKVAEDTCWKICKNEEICKKAKTPELFMWALKEQAYFKKLLLKRRGK